MTIYTKVQFKITV